MQQEVSALNGELQALRLSSLRKDREVMVAVVAVNDNDFMLIQ